MAQPGKPNPPKAATPAKPAAPAAAAAQPVPAPAAKAQPAAAPKPAAKPTAAAPGGPERARMISEAAYFIAQQRGSAGNPLADWLAAEKQIDSQLGARR